MHGIDCAHRNRQYQHTFTKLEYALSRSYSRKALSNALLHQYGLIIPVIKDSIFDNHEVWGSKGLNEGDCESQSPLIDAESQSDLRPLPRQLHFFERVLSHCDYSPPSSIFLNLLQEDGTRILAYEIKRTSGYANYRDSSFCSSSDTVSQFDSTTWNTTPLSGRIIVMAYGYKSMLSPTLTLIHEKPVLILNTKPDVKYKDIMRIISDFCLATPEALSIEEPPLDKIHTHSTGSSTISTTTDRGYKDDTILFRETAIGRTSTMGLHRVNIFYLHPVLNIWCLVKHRAVWSAAVQLSLQSKQPLRVMISRNHEKKMGETFSHKSFEGVTNEHKVTRSISDPKEPVLVHCRCPLSAGKLEAYIHILSFSGSTENQKKFPPHGRQYMQDQSIDY